MVCSSAAVMSLVWLMERLPLAAPIMGWSPYRTGAGSCGGTDIQGLAFLEALRRLDGAITVLTDEFHPTPCISRLRGTLARTYVVPHGGDEKQ
jgi:hypothetical protein